MFTRSSIYLLCFVALLTLGNAVFFGFLSLRAMDDDSPRRQRMARTTAMLSEAQASLLRARAGVYAFMASPDEKSMPEAQASFEDVIRQIAAVREDLGRDEAARLDGLMRKCAETARALRELEPAVRMLWDMQLNIVRPYMARAMQIVREDILEKAESHQKTALGATLMEALSATGASFHAFFLSRTESGANKAKADLDRVTRLVTSRTERGGPGGKPEYAAKLRDVLSTLDRSIARMREAAALTEWKLASVERDMREQAGILREFLVAADGAERDGNERLLDSLRKETWITISVAAGGMVLSLILGMGALVSLTRLQKRSVAAPKAG